MILEPRQCVLLQAVWRSGRLSRSALHEHTGMRLNTIGGETAALLEARVLRECDVQANGRGRPRVPLEIDPVSRHVLGVAIRPGRAEVGRVNLLGEPIEAPTVAHGHRGAAVIRAAARLLEQRLNDDTLAIGLTAPGFIDPQAQRVLFSSALPGGREASLQPIYDAAGRVPIALENDAHALAAHWSLAHPGQESQDLLLVFLDDGQLGASLLIGGKPNRGCVNGANELGHTRLPVATAACYCGHDGCLERICSSEYLAQRHAAQRHGNGRPLAAPPASLAERAAAYDGHDPDLENLIDLLSLGLANAVNFTRVQRLVLASELTAHARFAQVLVQRIREQTLSQLARRVTIDVWGRLASQQAQAAGCLVLAHLYCEGWNSLLTVGGRVQEDISNVEFRISNLKSGGRARAARANLVGPPATQGRRPRGRR